MFGGEWCARSLAAAFVALSGQHGALWLDQLSIPQDPQLIPLHLQNMPNIYRTFEVVVLQPDAPCPCLAEAVAMYEAGGEQAKRFYDDTEDFDLRRRVDACIHAVPISSYHYRLWTKQEFVHARTISVHYCGPPAGPCTRDTQYEWSVRTRTLSSAQRAFLGRWSGWLYDKFRVDSAEHGEWQDEAAWSTMEQHLAAGLTSIMLSVWSFVSRKDIDYVEANLRKHGYLIARFILGNKISRTKNDLEELIFFSDMGGGHVASVAHDYILAVFPTVSTYRIPTNAASLSVAALLDDALAQYENITGEFTQTRLPRGLFDLGHPGSMRCQPSLFLPPTEHIKSIRDVYGSTETGLFRPIPPAGHVMLSLRARKDDDDDDDDPNSARSPSCFHSRMPSATTYASAFPSSDPESTDKAQKFLRAASAAAHHHFGPLHLTNPLASWARAVIRGDILFSRAKGHTWPSPAHEKAVFDAMLHVGESREDWGDDLPLVDHEAVVYALMCDFLAIRVDVAKERGLGLVVKQRQRQRQGPRQEQGVGGRRRRRRKGGRGAPCVGMFNPMVHKGLREIEEWQRRNRDCDREPSKSPRTRNTHLFAEDWLTVYLGGPRRDICYECFKADKQMFDLAGTTSVPIYMVVGVWFTSRNNNQGNEDDEDEDDGDGDQDEDDCIGADVTRVWDKCGAVLF